MLRHYYDGSTSDYSGAEKKFGGVTIPKNAVSSTTLQLATWQQVDNKNKLVLHHKCHQYRSDLKFLGLRYKPLINSFKRGNYHTFCNSPPQHEFHMWWNEIVCRRLTALACLERAEINGCDTYPSFVSMPTSSHLQTKFLKQKRNYSFARRDHWKD